MKLRINYLSTCSILTLQLDVSVRHGIVCWRGRGYWSFTIPVVEGFFSESRYAFRAAIKRCFGGNIKPSLQFGCLIVVVVGTIRLGDGSLRIVLACTLMLLQRPFSWCYPMSRFPHELSSPFLTEFMASTHTLPSSCSGIGGRVSGLQSLRT